MDLWAVVGALGGCAGALLSAVTLYFVVRTDRRERRSAPYVNLEVGTFGHATDADTGELLWHVWELTNSGTGDARISAVRGVGCEFDFDEQYPPITVVKPGSTVRMKVKPCDVGKAWVLIAWLSPHEPDGLYVQWFAPAPGPELEAALHAQPALKLGWWRLLPAWLRVRLRPVRAVGPGGAVATRVRPNSRRLGQDLNTALSLALPESETAGIKLPAR